MRQTPYTPLHIRRRGVSLMEVLISIFVSAVGLLGLAALIPAGQIQLNRATVSDHGTALGAKALREVRLRGLLDPYRWAYADGTRLLQPEATQLYPPADSDLLWGHLRNLYLRPQGVVNGGRAISGFMIDPIGVARAPANVDYTVAPANSSHSSTLIRLTLLDDFGLPLDRLLSDALCRLPDDLQLLAAQDLNPDAHIDAEPQQNYGDEGMRQTEGAFSWLLTLIREPELTGATYRPRNLGVWTKDPHRYIASVAIVYRRRFLPGLEAAVEVVSPSTTGSETFTGPTGGTVMIQSDGSRATTELIKDLQPGRWLILGRIENSPNSGLAWNALVSHPVGQR